jgi:hypothetical protein
MKSLVDAETMCLGATLSSSPLFCTAKLQKTPPQLQKIILRYQSKVS